MTKRRKLRTVDHRRHTEFLAVAEHFHSAAHDSMALEYWTAAGVLIVHAAIAYADALSIKLSGRKSSGDDHEEAIALVDSAVAESDGKSIALSQLRRIIEEKTKVSYLGEILSPAQTRTMWKQLERFRKWALTILNR